MQTNQLRCRLMTVCPLWTPLLSGNSAVHEQCKGFEKTASCFKTPPNETFFLKTIIVEAIGTTRPIWTFRVQCIHVFFAPRPLNHLNTGIKPNSWHHRTIYSCTNYHIEFTICISCSVHARWGSGIKQEILMPSLNWDTILRSDFPKSQMKIECLIRAQKRRLRNCRTPDAYLKKVPPYSFTKRVLQDQAAFPIYSTNPSHLFFSGKWCQQSVSFTSHKEVQNVFSWNVALFWHFSNCQKHKKGAYQRRSRALEQTSPH